MGSATHPVIGAVTAIVSIAAMCLAGYWEVEQVDSGSLGSYVAMDRMSDGTVWLAYVNRDSAIRLAHKDSVWEFEDLDTATVRPGFPSWPTWPPFSFDVGPGDVIGVVGLARFAEFTDSGWSSEQLPMPMTDMAFSYDSASRPSLTFKDSLWHGCLGVWTDSGWDTSVVFVPQDAPSWFSLTRPCWRRHGNCAFMYGNDWGDLIQQYSIGLCRRDTGIWTGRGLAGGLDGLGYVFAALPDRSDSIHTFWSAGDNHFTNKLVCDGVVLDSFAGIGAACLDDSGRVQCVWGRGGRLKFALVPEPAIEVADMIDLGWCDITTDTLLQPVIAYCVSDGSIWVAHGVDVAGIGGELQGSAVRLPQLGGSIVRSVLFLPYSLLTANASLLSIDGRKVMDLRPGTNDVRAMAPGVYFVGEGLGTGSQGPGRIRKVVITR